MPSRSFFSALEALQKKSDKEKDKIIFITVCVVMIGVIAIWISLPQKEATEQQMQEQQAGPFRVLWQEIKNNTPEF
ncbi:MAG: hypothetical protein COU47_02265 [Candidatus Niyogibacteria bacterium CG10_big_fil_rev_8_21_14_0_10_46_36]|uniref:Uncharacterized protein n=1 Tax=Candidatus Niyogibacteria bacterium CG10_big_fil_rev_8_21_14_0_10_46_36 TaxID=1974726 RepID=A0A2H0TDC3_9BACT|nr:MAG: hypothetical protein COU47_02265 [Candidatus Niyogibacteria bacterium CG10_big_fil_rev_8_21_14_0_10_46_36]